MYMWNEGGFGGGPDLDGGDAPTMAMYATGSRNQPIEVHERFYPVVFTELVIAEDSAGPGKWRGCPGIRHSYRLTHGEGVIGVFGDRNKFKPWGVRGGLAGGGQTVYINRGQDTERVLGMFASDVPVQAGDVVEVWSSGGGGYGDPTERDPEAVAQDVLLGFVSVDAARAVYGVVLHELQGESGTELTVDADATRTLRARLRDP
jgi:N-methylhydantoinase B